LIFIAEKEDVAPAVRWVALHLWNAVQHGRWKSCFINIPIVGESSNSNLMRSRRDVFRVGNEYVFLRLEEPFAVLDLELKLVGVDHAHAEKLKRVLRRLAMPYAMA
jgi:hypothetical protein